MTASKLFKIILGVAPIFIGFIAILGWLMERDNR